MKAVTRRSGAAGVICLWAVLVTAGCGSAHEDQVNSTASDFYSALAGGEGQAACRLLAPKTRSELEQSAKKPCDQAILEEGVAQPGAHRRTQVFGTMAEVRFSHDTAFLAEFDQGWRIMATACQPVPGEPFDCSVEGG